MNDIPLGTTTQEEHNDWLRKLLDRICAAGARLQLRKCRFGVREVETLGHRVTANGIRLSAANMNAIQKLREPCNAASLLRFVEIVSFSAKIVPEAALYLAPLYKGLE
jgi:hypothetical protein